MVHALDCKPLHWSSTEVYSDCGLCVLCYSVVSLTTGPGSGKWKLKCPPSCLGGYHEARRVLLVDGLIKTRNDWASAVRHRRCMMPGLDTAKTECAREPQWGRLKECDADKDRKCASHSPALCLWPHCVPVPTHIRSQAHQANVGDPIFLLALTEWTETANLGSGNIQWESHLGSATGPILAETHWEAKSSSA